MRHQFYKGREQMKKITLSNEYLSAFTLQLSLLIHAGINIGDGIHLLAEDEKNKQAKEILEKMAEDVDDGLQLSEAMKNTACFPDYIVQMTSTGEATGRVEDALKALTEYYENRRQLGQRIQSALTYPLLLLALMLVIIGILLTRVLPIFNTVYQQLGGSLTGMAAGMLAFGKGLDRALPVIGVIVGILLVIGIVLGMSEALRKRAVLVYKRFFGDRGITRKVGMAHFASALSMGMQSGLPMEEALKNAMEFHEDSPKAKERYEKCLVLLEEGEPLADALKQAGVFAPMYCRMLALGVKSGAGDSIMEEIAVRLEEEANCSIEEAVAKIEPTIVITTSVIIGIILLSVMLPLINIMSSIA